MLIKPCYDRLSAMASNRQVRESLSTSLRYNDPELSSNDHYVSRDKTMPGPSPEETAKDLAKILEQANRKVVLVESCTAGLAAALLGGVPGVSRFLCGSIVAYQDKFKSTWLQVDPALIEQHTSVSQPVTKEMAERAIAATPFADLSCAITGHLGPDAPAAIDGKVFVAIANHAGGAFAEFEHSLTSKQRIDRQHEAAAFMLRKLADALE